MDRPGAAAGMKEGLVEVGERTADTAAAASVDEEEEDEDEEAVSAAVDSSVEDMVESGSCLASVCYTGRCYRVMVQSAPRLELTYATPLLPEWAVERRLR